MNSDLEMQEFILSLRSEFLSEAAFLLEQCEEHFLNLENPEIRQEEITKIFRVAHTIKGSSASVGFEDIKNFAHVFEDFLSGLRVCPESFDKQSLQLMLRANDCLKNRVSALRNGSDTLWHTEDLVLEIKAGTAEIEGKIEGKIAPTAHTAPVGPEPSDGLHLFEESSNELKTNSKKEPHISVVEQNAHIPASPHSKQSPLIRIEATRLDSLLDILGELVVLKSQITTEASVHLDNARLNSICASLDRTVRDLQDRALSLRMTSMKPIFVKMRRLVHDLAAQTHKPVTLEIAGEDTEVDRNMVDLLADPIMHMVRNAVDHGLEKDPETRKSLGKKPEGRVFLSARQMGGRVLVTIEDDGAGLNRQRIQAKAVEKGLLTEASAPLRTDTEIFDFIFAPGFSTAEKVSDLSGRGVGMDVVKSNIEKMGGRVTIESHPGRGSRFTISLPLTTAIADGMCVVVAGQAFVLPMDSVRELVEVNQTAITLIDPRNATVRVRENLYPLIELKNILSSSFAQNSSSTGLGRIGKVMVVVVECAGRCVAVTIDKVEGQSQVVLKALDHHLVASEFISGAAVMGDGRIALVVNVDEIGKTFDSGHQRPTAARVAA